MSFTVGGAARLQLSLRKKYKGSKITTSTYLSRYCSYLIINLFKYQAISNITEIKIVL
jgi:hypothetical protein